MKTLFTLTSFLFCVFGYSQKYTIGLVKTGSVIKNVEAQIVVSDTEVKSTFDSVTTVYKITSRSGYTIHVTDGKSNGKYVISHSKGRMHGFTYDSHITYHPEKHHPGTHLSVFYSMVKRD